MLIAGMTAVLVATGGGAAATAQPSTTPASPTSPAPAALQQQAPAPADPCAPTTPPTTTTAPLSTTTSAVPTSCVDAPSPAPPIQQTLVPQSENPDVADVPTAAPSSTSTTITTATPSAEATAPTPTGKRIPYTGLPTENPNSTLVPGKMRSDREEWPEGYTKEQADQAEIGEARLLAKQRTSRAAVTCQRYWPSNFDVCGAIRDKYNSLGGVGSFLFLPTSGNIINPGGTGERVTFANGPIYWSAAGGAHPVVNSFLNRWGILGYEGSYLKYPTTDEIVLPDGGRRQEFQDGAIYVSFQNAIGSAIQNGPLRDKYNSVGGLTPGSSLLGYLTEDHIRTLPDGQGQMARFQNGVIYYHPTYGAWVVRGGILNHWEFIGFEGGTLGYPASDEYVENGAIKQLFENHLLEFGALEPDPSTPQARADFGNPIEFYAGDEKVLRGVGGTLNIRRNSAEFDSRKLSYGFEISQSAILYRAQYGTSTPKDCTTAIYSRSRGVHFKDNDPRHKNMIITRVYHNSVGNHDDNREYALNISCGFHNKTQNLNGRGTLAYGYFVAHVDRTYIFRIR
ncbi:LGFP repeat-containing protein [Rhodococcoides corynebacterioides]|nr:hypothetical protein [Rhodococcus corynebacterioides]